MTPHTGILVSASLGAVVCLLLCSRARKSRDRRDKLLYVPVGSFLQPFNFVFNVLRECFGISIFNIKRKKFIAMSEAIAEMTDTTLFGNQQEFLNGVKAFVEGPDQSLMSGSGIILFNNMVERLLSVRKQCIEYIQANSELVLQSRLKFPIIVTGLPRTGSTMLYNLLSCDPDARSPLFFELSQMADITPPVTSKEERDNDSRIQLVMKRFDETERLFPGMWTEASKSHRSHPSEIEEDVLVLFHSFIMEVHVFLTDPTFRKWFENEDNKEFAYVYHRLFFQMLNAMWKPKSHWVLKSPVHSMYMDAIEKQYPDARFVITHRYPLSVVPSNARLVESYIHWHYLPYVCKRHSLGQYNKESLLLCAKRLIKWEQKTDSSKYLNVIYSELCQDPIRTVERIYSHFNMHVSPAFRQRMEIWIEKNKQGKHGRQSYSLSEYGHTEEEILCDFRSYVETFLKS